MDNGPLILSTVSATEDWTQQHTHSQLKFMLEGLSCIVNKFLKNNSILQTYAGGRNFWGWFGKEGIYHIGMSVSVFSKTPWLKINFLNCIVNCWSLISAKCDWNLGEKWTWAPPGVSHNQFARTRIAATFLKSYNMALLPHYVQINDLFEVEMVDDYPQLSRKLLRAPPVLSNNFFWVRPLFSPRTLL